MDREFWLDRWQREEIGFHQADVNPYLRDYWSRLDCAPPARVFVPLCGKSHDMLWLARQGYDVVGVELSELAVAAFFKENDIEVRRASLGPFEVWQSNAVTILCGDFFALEPQHLGQVDAVFDRASLIAMPDELRRRYAAHFVDVMPHRPPVLLVTMEYRQAEMQGPPFSVAEEEVRGLYADAYNVQRLTVEDIWASTPRFQEKGLSALEEKVYSLERN